MNKKYTPKISVGITSLIVVLTVLCLTILAVMTLNTALSEKQLSLRSAEAARNYYAAETACISAANSVSEAWLETGNGEYAKKIGEDIGCTAEAADEEIRFFYEKKIDEKQLLKVSFSLDINAPDNGVVINECLVSTTEEWIADDSLNVWDGEFIQ